MPHVRGKLVRHGLRFTNGYVVNPTCCPSRASILTGNYSHTTRVYLTRPNEPLGGFGAFDDHDTIATRLHDAGYRTGLFGKYLNGYDEHGDYVPPGWDRWFATFRDGYFDYGASSNGERVAFGHTRSSYGVTVLRRRVLSFIRTSDPAVPFFAYVAPYNPHEPAIPAPSDIDSFASLVPHRPRSYDEADVSDKPRYVRKLGRIDGKTASEIDDFRLAQVRSLQAVDRLVNDIIEELRAAGTLANTMIVFTSDNGMLWGEHRWTGKGIVYEEATHVPFLVRYDSLTDRATTDHHLVLNIDLAPTVAEAAGIDVPPMDGKSLLPLMTPSGTFARKTFLIEHLRSREDERLAPTFCAAHTRRYVLARYSTGEEELYDLKIDPRQLQNMAGRNRYVDVRHTLEAALRRLCDPAPPGYSF